MERSGRHAAPPPARTRRWVLGWSLAGSAALIAGGGAGVAAEILREPSARQRPRPPRALVDAAAAERRLLADLTATTGGSAEVRQLVRAVAADHRAHLVALESLLAAYRAPSGPSSVPSGVPLTKAQLRDAESGAASAAARRAAGLSGAPAALLASIAACETTHAELLR
jgi:hypothetical protein